MNTRVRKMTFRVMTLVLLVLFIIMLLRDKTPTLVKKDLARAEAIDTTPMSVREMQKQKDRIPLTFEANAGQTDSRAKFICRNSAYTLFLTDTGPVLSLYSRIPDQESSPTRKYGVSRMELKWQGGRANIRGERETVTKTNYFIGNNQDEWHTNISNFEKVVYDEYYPGISFSYYGKDRSVEYDIVAKPGADLSKLSFDVVGADRVEVVKSGNLIAQLGRKIVIQSKPVAFVAEDHTLVSAEFVVTNGHVGFKVGEYDHSKTLVIDPDINYGTYLGDDPTTVFSVQDPFSLNFYSNDGVDRGYAVAVDASGAVYATGETNSVDFPTTAVIDGYQNINGDTLPPDQFYRNTLGGRGIDYNGETDAYILKLSPDGGSIVFCSFFGGHASDSGRGVAVDNQGNVFFTGIAGDGTFPPKAQRFVYSGGLDGFLVKLTPSGSGVLFSTCFGGSGNDIPTGLAVDKTGAPHVSGTTNSPNFMNMNTAQSYATLLKTYPPAATTAGFVAKFTPDGRDVAYASFICGPAAGPSRTTANGIAVDANNNAYVGGSTNILDISIIHNSIQGSYGGGSSDGYILKLDQTGGEVFGTYVGGNGADSVNAIAVDATSRIIAVGSTGSTDFRTVNSAVYQNPNATPFQPLLKGSTTNAFYLLLQNNGLVTDNFTYLGGTGTDSALAVSVDAAGYAYITGSTTSTDLVLTQGIQSGNAGGTDVFVSKFNPTGGEIYTTYIGSTGFDAGHGIAAGSVGTGVEGLAYVTGEVGAGNGPFGNLAGFQPSPGVLSPDAFIVAVGDSSPRITSPNFLSILLSNSVDYQITATNNPTTFGAKPLSTCQLICDPNGHITGTPLVAGRYQIEVAATNISGTGTEFLTIAVNDLVPAFQPRSPASGIVGTSFNYLIVKQPPGIPNTTPDPSQNPTSYGASPLPPGLVVDTITGVISGIPQVAGSYNLTISATNNVGTGTTPLTINVTPQPPIISSTGTVSGTVNLPFTYTILASSNPTSYAISSGTLPAGLTLDSVKGIISGTPQAVGVSTVQLVAINGGGTSVPLTLVLTIDSTPIVNSPAAASGTLNQVFGGYTITALNGPTSFGATGLPPGLTVNAGSGAITGTPTLAGQFNVSVTASNLSGTGKFSVTFSINPGPPTVTSGINVTVPLGASVKYVITATNSPTSFTATNLPPGLVFDGTTGIISGTPTSLGSTIVVVGAVNSAGPGPTLNVTFTVTPSPPTITSPLVASGGVNNGFTYTITAIGSTPITFTASPLPPGLFLNGSAISGVPTAEGTYAVILTATNLLATDTKTLVISITNIINSIKEVDTDGDGFPDEVEVGVGTDPKNPTSTPFGGAPAGTKHTLNITSMQIKLDFSSAASTKDSITLKGTLPVPSTYNGNAKNVVVFVGGVVRQFGTIGATTPAGSKDTFKLKVTKSQDPSNAPFAKTPKTVSPNALTADFQVKISNASFKQALFDEGLLGTAQIKSPSARTVDVIILFQDFLGFYQSAKVLQYTVSGKTGSARNGR